MLRQRGAQGVGVLRGGFGQLQRRRLPALLGGAALLRLIFGFGQRLGLADLRLRAQRSQRLLGAGQKGLGALLALVFGGLGLAQRGVQGAGLARLRQAARQRVYPKFYRLAQRLVQPRAQRCGVAGQCAGVGLQGVQLQQLFVVQQISAAPVAHRLALRPHLRWRSISAQVQPLAMHTEGVLAGLDLLLLLRHLARLRLEALRHIGQVLTALLDGGALAYQIALQSGAKRHLAGQIAGVWRYHRTQSGERGA